MRRSRLSWPALVLAAACALAVTGAARADSLASLPEPDYAADARNPQQRPLPTEIQELVYPTVGCPSIVAPGGELLPIVRLQNGGTTSDWTARIESARDLLVQTVPLQLRRLSYDAATGTYRLAFGVPAFVPEDTYDLVIESQALPRKSDGQPNAVRVLRERLDYDFVHIADTQIRDPTTQLPQKFAEVLREIKLRDPAFTLYSGDLNFGADYAREYPESRQIFRDGACPVVCAPGNHDGYAWLSSATQAYYDGHYYWRRTIGPTYFSMRWGGVRYIAANSFGGPASRRNAYTFLTINAGGDIEPDQLAWIESEGRAAGAAGDEALIFLHHNPRPTIPLSPGYPAYPWQLSQVGKGNGIWNGQASRDELTRILGAHPALRWVLAGHTNRDEHIIERRGSGATEHDVHYVNTTSPCNGGNPQEGYRVVSVRGGRIAGTDYEPQQPSVPFPLGGNLAAAFIDANDGRGTIVRARVTSALAHPVDVTLKFFVRPDPRGYRVGVGTIREVGLADAGAYVVYVRVTVPGQGSVEPSVLPDLEGRGARPAFLGGTGGGSTSGGATAGASGSTRSGAGACSAVPGATAEAAATWALLAAVLAGVRVGRRARR